MELHLRMSSSPLDAKISREPILNQDFAKRRTIAAACYRKKWSLICFLCFHRPFKATVMMNNWNKVEKVHVGGSSIGFEYFITCTVCTTYHIIITITLHSMIVKLWIAVYKTYYFWYDSISFLSDNFLWQNF